MGVVRAAHWGFGYAVDVPGPYDRLFKTLAEEDPRGLLHLFGSLSLEAKAEIEVLDRELNLPTRAVDHLCRVRTGKRQWLVHYEVQTHYNSDLPQRLARYGQVLALLYQIPIETVLILLVERHAPKKVPTGYHLDLGSIRIVAQYRVVRVWQLDGNRILKTRRASLLPWVSLANSSQRDLQQAAGRIASSRDRELAAKFVVLGGLRYDKDDLAAMLGKVGSMLTQEMIEESSFYQMIIEKGVAKGMEKGITKGIERGMEKGLARGRRVGRLDEARRNLRRILALRFPQIQSLPELNALKDLGRIEALLDALVTAKDARSARAAIQGVVRNGKR